MDNHNKIKSEKYKFNISNIITPAQSMNPLYSTMGKEIRDLFKQIQLEDKFNILEFSGLFLKTSDPHIFKTYNLLILWIAYIDDAFDEQTHDPARWVKVIGDGNNSGNTLLDNMFNVWYKEMNEIWNKSEVNRFMAALKCWLQGYENDMMNKYKKGLISAEEIDYNHYLKMRQLDCCCYVFSKWNEIVSKVDINKVMADKKVYELYKMFTDVVVLCSAVYNDITSFKKEILDNVYKYNYVYLKMKKESINAQKAVDIIVVEYNNWRKMMKYKGEELKLYSIDGLSDYVSTSYEFVYANENWSNITERFHTN